MGSGGRYTEPQLDHQARAAMRKRSLHINLGICINGPTPARYLVMPQLSRKRVSEHGKPVPGEIRCERCKRVHRGSRVAVDAIFDEQENAA